MRKIHALFTIGNILSFALVSNQIYLGFVIGVIAATIGLWIFKREPWLMITQIFYLIINMIKI
jgi:hypothetical protein